MSALLRLRLATPKLNQFVRPKSPFDVVSTTQRLASSGEWFATAPEYAKAIARGKASKLVDALMATLGNATVMSTEDTCNIVDLYTIDGCSCKVPPSTAEAGGDEATGTPATSVALACSKKGTLSSSEDETSNDVTPLGESVGTKPMDNEPLVELDTIFTESARKRQRHMIVRLTRK